MAVQRGGHMTFFGRQRASKLEDIWETECPGTKGRRSVREVRGNRGERDLGL